MRDFEGCAQYYMSAAQRWKSLGGNAEKQGMDLYKASLNYLLAQRFDLSETSACDAVTCFKGVETENGKNYYWMSMLSWGDALYCQNKNEEALAIYQQGLDGYSQWKPGSEKHADVLEDMAKVEVRLKKYEEAKAHYQAALDIYKKLNLDTKYSNIYSMLLVCLRKAGDRQERKAFQLGIGAAAGHGIFAKAIDVALDNNVCQCNHTVLYTGGQTVAHDVHQAFFVETDLLDADAVRSIYPKNMDKAQKGADTLRNSGGNGCCADTPMENSDK